MICSKKINYKTRDYCDNLLESCAIMKVRRFRGRNTRLCAFFLSIPNEMIKYIGFTTTPFFFPSSGKPFNILESIYYEWLILYSIRCKDMIWGPESCSF